MAGNVFPAAARVPGASPEEVDRETSALRLPWLSSNTRSGGRGQKASGGGLLAEGARGGLADKAPAGWHVPASPLCWRCCLAGGPAVLGLTGDFILKGVFGREGSRGFANRRSALRVGLDAGQACCGCCCWQSHGFASCSAGPAGQ